MLKTITLAIAAAVVLLLIYASTRPDQFRVERSQVINAPAERIYGLVNDFHLWTQWSPWEKLDPAMQRSYSGTPSGMGTAYAWTGNSKVGAGRMEIVEAQPPHKLVLKLDFIKPFEGHNLAEFSFTATGQATEVRWSMHGPSPFISKLMGLFFDMDKLIGKDFAEGLANLKAVAEK